MKTILSAILLAAALSSCKKENTTSITPTTTAVSIAALPTKFKVAYYAYDATPNLLPLTNFANEANVVVLFEGRPWEFADSVHYGSSSSYILTVNPNYHSYKSIMDHVHVLQARGVKVLYNIDDANSWNTTTPFTTWNGTGLSYTQFAAFVKAIIVDSLHLDGIALDVEHMGSTSANNNFRNLCREFGKYFGPLSSDPANTVYAAAIYSGAAAGNALGKDTSVSKYLNFVEDMGYEQNNTTRFNNWANVIGSSKTMVGVSKQLNTISNALAAAAWLPSSGSKAGIMVFAGNVDSSYTNRVFRALQ